MKIILPQQSLFLLRSLLSAVGWAKTYKEQFISGRLLAERLPEPEVDWVKSPAQLQAMSQEERSAYRAADKAWAAAPIELEICDQDRDVCRKAIEKMIESGQVGCSPYMYRLLNVFGFQAE